MSLFQIIHRNGFIGSAEMAFMLIKMKIIKYYWSWSFRDAPKYANPTTTELEAIERDLTALGIAIHEYLPPLRHSRLFKTKTGSLQIIMVVC